MVSKKYVQCFHRFAKGKVVLQRKPVNACEHVVAAQLVKMIGWIWPCGFGQVAQKHGFVMPCWM